MNILIHYQQEFKLSRLSCESQLVIRDLSRKKKVSGMDVSPFGIRFSWHNRCPCIILKKKRKRKNKRVITRPIFHLSDLSRTLYFFLLSPVLTVLWDRKALEIKGTTFEKSLVFNRFWINAFKKVIRRVPPQVDLPSSQRLYFFIESIACHRIIGGIVFFYDLATDETSVTSFYEIYIFSWIYVQFTWNCLLPTDI